ncbi:thiamine pyrophosphate-binding protein [Haliangium ochraceum]|uniref:Thiamine pyrophosphate protein TPP binding domain protein n=1 Tax=Haliangium ochraceum (strain DSM 14365 / JCM 11303 / SMP-2) TaxID=502025 RepID=D0LGS7_HALO1|nr:thiamine pyrophosphate-binding protein [Haliangium ochraceum]ACY14649.1 thiamine pyrophosphate protein TPP binding domain protein [Haliangium ochraceum DSM 14365]
MNGGRRIADVLVAQGVRQLFTLCGGHIAPILVESQRRDIQVVDVRHEANAVFAADAVARLTGIPGVAAVTAGPGVTNALTAIKNAQLAQSPLVLLGGATATLLRGRGALQDIDQMALIKPHVKWAARPRSLREIVPALERAFAIARRGVPGPVFVELAVDLLYDERLVREWFLKDRSGGDPTLGQRAQDLYIRGHLAYVFAEARAVRLRPPAPAPLETPSMEDVAEAARVIAQSERPLMVLGSQSMLHPTRARELVAAVERIGVPVYLSGMARGLLGRSHNLLMRHKRRVALREADTVILCGVPCDFRLDYGAHVARAHVIGVNLSREDLSLNRKPDLAINADPLAFLNHLSRVMPAQPASYEAWRDTLIGRERAREDEIRAMAGHVSGSDSSASGEADGGGINPLALCQALDNVLADDSVIVGDGGDFVATASYTVAPRGPYSWLDPGVFGTLGVGAGFALGAKLVRPSADVWLLYGDGAAGFSIMEFDTFARHGIPVIAVVGNDAGWTQIARDQVDILGTDTACRLTHMDYDQVASACGAHGIRINDLAQVPGALREAVEVSREGRPVLINAILAGSDFRKGSLSM